MMKYIGNGRFLPNIPARDLTTAEVKQYGGEKFLVESGLYKRATTRKKKSMKEGD